MGVIFFPMTSAEKKLDWKKFWGHGRNQDSLQKVYGKSSATCSFWHSQKRQKHWQKQVKTKPQNKQTKPEAVLKRECNMKYNLQRGKKGIALNYWKSFSVIMGMFYINAIQ